MTLRPVLFALFVVVAVSTDYELVIPDIPGPVCTKSLAAR